MTIESTESVCVLNIEDDPDIALLLATLLGRAGHRVVSATDGREGLRLFHDERPDLVIVDLGVPHLDGWTLISRVREVSSVPVLVLTARDSEADIVRGLREGADDYLTKPFGNAELVARVQALLRRGETQRDASQSGWSGGSGASGASGGHVTPVAVTEHGCEIDFAARTVHVANGEVELTPMEWRLLEVFVRHKGQVLSLEQLLQRAWRDPTATGPDRVKFAVLRLRRKLGWATLADSPIETVRGFGYRYRPSGTETGRLR